MQMVELSRVLDEIDRNPIHGATRLALVAAEALREWGRGGPDPPLEDLLALVQRVAGTRPSMAPFLNLAAHLSSAIAGGGGGLRARLGEAAAGFGRQIAASPRAIGTRVVQAGLGDRAVLTYSAGESVRAAMLALHHAGRPLRVVVSESRPALEGRALAEQLASAGVPVRLVVDAALAGQLAGADALWVGADALTPDGLIHKIGTAALAREARDRGLPVRTLASRVKWVGPDLAPRLRLEDGDPAAVSIPLAGIEIVNPLFDVTPWEHLDTVISEAGVVGAPAAREELIGRDATPSR